MHGPLQSFDLEAEITRLREEKEWQRGRRNAITLRKGEGLNVVLLVMKEGSRSTPHPVPSRWRSERGAFASPRRTIASRPDPKRC